ncbi:MDR family oxidoreductase [Candidatus Nitrospira bockiana]
MRDRFTALLLDQREGKVHAELCELPLRALPDGDVLVSVAYSSLNYKDGLAVTGRGKVVRRFPMVPGIDLAGVVEASASPDFAPGDRVLVTGWGIGEEWWGGYAQAARVKAEWLIKLPPDFGLDEAMGIGTAGLTAMLSLMALEEHGLRPEGGEVLVTGASGGVGSLAVALLSSVGYQVTASTGRTESHAYLRDLGATAILDRAVLAAASQKALDPERWAGAVDSVGGDTLATILRTLRHRAAVAVCGLAGGSQLATTVFPFLLRGVSMLGIASSTTPRGRRLTAWARLFQELPREKLHRVMRLAPLREVPHLSEMIVEGRIRGRVVIDVGR